MDNIAIPIRSLKESFQSLAIYQRFEVLWCLTFGLKCLCGLNIRLNLVEACRILYFPHTVTWQENHKISMVENHFTHHMVEPLLHSLFECFFPPYV